MLRRVLIAINLAMLIILAGVWYWRSISTPLSPVTLSTEKDSDWKRLWDLRLAELRKVFGQENDRILTAIPLFYLGGGRRCSDLSKTGSGSDLRHGRDDWRQ